MRKVVKWVGIAVAVLLVIAAGLVVRGGMVLNRMATTAYQVPPITISAAARRAATVKRGEHMFQARGMCAECHAEDGGGKLLFDNLAIGTFGGVNLTRRVLERSDEDLVRSIRHGVHRDGTPNWMPSSGPNRVFTEVDLLSLIKYVRALPKVDRVDKPVSLGLMIKVMLGLGLPFPVDAAKIDHTKPYPKPVAERRGVAFGRFLVQGICADCHKEDLTGGTMEGSPPGFPPAANLTQDALGTWSEADFLRTVKTGVNPSGSKLREPMGNLTKYLARYTDTELKSIWDYLKTVKGKADF